MNPSQEEVREWFDYHTDGYLIWRHSPQVKRNRGKVAGTKTQDYVRIKTPGGGYHMAHRLIFLWHFGYLPEVVDHINRTPLDNRIENLRGCTIAENSQNQSPYSNCSSKYKGVCWHKSVSRWAAFICANNQKKYLGCRDTEEEAAALYNEAARILHGEYAVLNKVS